MTNISHDECAMPTTPFNDLPALQQLEPTRFENRVILKKLVSVHRRLAELKGLVQSMPNPGILVNSLGLQEAKDSSEIENIVTTHDELFRESLQPEASASATTKEVARYRQALDIGWRAVQGSGLLTLNHILHIQAELEQNQAGFRKLPGTALKNSAGDTVYTPPSPEYLPALMKDLEAFINNADDFATDPLIKMALVHHQFESIHPFYDGNGRTGRIINVLYLVKEGLLGSPILYLSRAIVRSKQDYYRLLQQVREQDGWEDWVCYMLDAVEWTAVDTMHTVQAIKQKMMDYKHAIRAKYRFYSQDLINLLFSHPYSKIEAVEKILGVTRKTAANYLNLLAEDGFLQKYKPGRDNYYINTALFDILTSEMRPTQ